MKQEAPEAPPGAGLATVLVVDDDETARRMFTDILESQGFRVLVAASAEEVFPRLEQADLVLLDAMLPGRDGWQVCRQIKEEFDPLLPIIMVTARTNPDDVVRTFAVGADDYVAKPFQVAELTARIESRLRVRRAEQGLLKANRRLAALAEQNFQLYEQARRDADERKLLLKELNHRVGNNLSVLLGLVSMERNRCPQRCAEDALASLETRMRSFVLVLDILRTHNYRGVPVREIAQGLGQRLRSQRNLNGCVELEVAGEAITLGERPAFAIGMALSELIDNALRHAFLPGQAGKISIAIAEKHGQLHLQVADDGHGLPPDLGPHQLGTGHAIVDALIRKELGGRVRFDSNSAGTVVHMVVPQGANPADGPAASPTTNK